MNRLSSRGWGEETVERKRRGERGRDRPNNPNPTPSPLGHFNLSQSPLPPSSHSHTLPAGACLQAKNLGGEYHVTRPRRISKFAHIYIPNRVLLKGTITGTVHSEFKHETE